VKLRLSPSSWPLFRSLPWVLASCLLALATGPAAAWTGVTATATVKGWQGEGEDAAAGALYLRVGSSAASEKWRLALDAYGRAAGVTPEDGAGGLSRLYSLALTAESIDGALSATAGRQMLDLTTGSRVIDGLSATLVSGDWSFSGRAGQVADVAGGSPSGTDDLGLLTRWTLREGMTLTLDYDRTARAGAVQGEAAALDWSYSWIRDSRAFITLDYDLVSQTFRDSSFGSRLVFSDLVTFSFEHREGIPTFDSSDIYSVFAVDAAESTTFYLLLTPADDLRYHWEYALESYQSGGGGKRYNLGVRWSPGTASLSADFTQQRGDLGLLNEFSLSASRPFGDRLRLAVGAEVASTSPRDGKGETGTMGWIGADYSVGGSLVSGRVENSTADVMSGASGARGDRAWSGRLAITREFLP
jgi:hypothetical protein